MKTKPSTLTPEQALAKANAEAFFADLLTPAPKGAKAKTLAKARVWRETATRNIVDKPGFTPEARIHILTTQLCTTCNSEHSYMSFGIIRYTTRQSRRDGLAIELPSSTTHQLVPTIQRVHETTDFCPTCYAMQQHIDEVLAAEAAPQQLRLFS